jgi:hypothetical protein
MNVSLLFFFVAVLIAGTLLFAVISLTKNGHRQLDTEKYRTRWLFIEKRLEKTQPASFQLCVLDADKLLDSALREKGYQGTVMADRMKNAAPIFSNRNSVWSAHKLRNQIAHEPDVRVTYDSSRTALNAFRQALKDLGAI